MKYPIALIACNRFEYFKQVVDSLKHQVKDRNIYLFLDKPLDNSSREGHNEYFQESFSKYNCCFSFIRSEHFGCGLNIIDARDTIFQTEAEAAFIFEDDLIVSSNYIKFTEEMYNKYTRTHFNVGAMQSWSECHLSLEEKKEKTLDVFSTYENLWGYLLSKRCWEDIKPLVMEYANLFLKKNADYRQRPHQEIYKWLLLQHIKHPRFLYPLSYINNKEEEIGRINYMKQFITGQDAVTIHSMYIKGYVRLATIVNRGKYIGERGVHKNPAMFKQMGYDKIEMFDDEIHCD